MLSASIFVCGRYLLMLQVVVKTLLDDSRRRYMAEIMRIQHKTTLNQYIKKSLSDIVTSTKMATRVHLKILLS